MKARFLSAGWAFGVAFAAALLQGSSTRAAAAAVEPYSTLERVWVNGPVENWQPSFHSLQEFVSTVKPRQAVLLRSQENQQDMVAIYAVAGQYVVVHRWDKVHRRAGFVPPQSPWLGWPTGGKPLFENDDTKDLDIPELVGSHFYEVTGRRRKIVVLRPYKVVEVVPGFKGYVGSGESLAEFGPFFLWPMVEWPEKGAAEAGLKEDMAAVHFSDAAARLAALRRLISKAGWQMHSIGSLSITSGSVRLDAYQEKAVQEVRQARSPDLVMQAIRSKDRALRHWAVRNFDGVKEESWKPILKELMRVAALDPDSGIRAFAVERLRFFGNEEAAAFLKERAASEEETSPNVWLWLSFDANSDNSQALFNRRALKWLSSENEAVRWEWLNHIANQKNPYTAPRYRVHYGGEVAHKVQELFDHPASEKEREAAAYAVKSFGEH